MTVDRERPRTRTADVVVSVVLLCAHLGLALFMAFVAPFLAMGTDVLLLGCLIQLALGTCVLRMASWAGPLR